MYSVVMVVAMAGAPEAPADCCFKIDFCCIKDKLCCFKDKLCCWKDHCSGRDYGCAGGGCAPACDAPAACPAPAAAAPASCCEYSHGSRSKCCLLKFCCFDFCCSSKKSYRSNGCYYSDSCGSYWSQPQPCPTYVPPATGTPIVPVPPTPPVQPIEPKKDMPKSEPKPPVKVGG